MKRKTPWLLLLASLCGGFTSLHADVTLIEHVDGMGTAIDSTEMVKPGHTRVDYPGLSTIRDLQSGELIRLVRAQKCYAKIPGRLTQTAFDAMKRSRVPPKDGASPTPTGRKETISGYVAEEYTWNASGTKISLWLTKAAPDYSNVLKEMSTAFDRGALGGMLPRIGLDAATLPGFPVRLVSESPSGRTTTTTVLAVSTAPIADSEFEIPADYKEISMPVAPTALEAATPASK